MKQFTLLLSALMLSVALFAGNPIKLKEGQTKATQTESSFEKMTTLFTFSSIESYDVKTDEGTFTSIYMPDAMYIGKKGEPKLPALTQLIGIPLGAEVEVNVKGYTVETFNLGNYGIENYIMPVQSSVSKSAAIDEIEFAFDKAAYQNTSKFSNEVVTVEILGVMRGIRIARVVVSPVSYSPSTNEIDVLNNIEVELNFVGGDVAATKDLYQNTYSPAFAVGYKELANKDIYDDLPDLYKYPVHMVVIADRMFETTLEPWLEWKAQKGFFLDVNYTDDIGATSNVLKTFCADKYNNAAAGEVPTFIVIVGDTPQVPASATGSATSKATDLYYGSIDGDIYPEMYYSRMSAQNVTQLENMIEKILYYERYEFEDPSYLDNVTLIAGADGTWNPSVGQPTVIYGTTNYFNAEHGFANVHDYLNSYSGCYATVDEGVGFINYTAHCSETSWGDPNLSISDVNGFTNTNKYPVAIGNCCLAADFGYGECMGEAWMRAPQKGAVGYIGSSPSSYWWEDFYWSVGATANAGGGYVPTVAESTIGSYDGAFTDTAYNCLSSMVLTGNLAVTFADNAGYETSVSPTYYWQAYNVIGDGSLMPFYTQADVNTVSHMAILPLGVTTYEVSAEPGSYAAISKDGELLGAAYIGTSGSVAVPITPVTAGGDVLIVVTRPQYQPYMETVPAAALTGAYIVYDSSTINDASGDGQLDFGEAAQLTIDMKNVGTDPSNDPITVTISSDDPELTITDATEEYPGFDPDEVIGVENGFAIEASYNIENGHVFAIDIVATDGTDTWESSMSLTAYAPALEMTSYIIQDGGNNNGFLDPGETGTFVITVKNNGGAAATTVEGLLTSTDSYLTIITTDPQPYGDIAAGEENTALFVVTASDAIPVGHTAELNLNVTADHDISTDGVISLEWADYCFPTGTNCSMGDEINDFAFGDISNMGSGCSPDGYGDFTAMSTNVELGQSYEVSVSCNYSSDNVSIWIDFNSDAIFTADELVVEDLECDDGGTFTAQIAIPADIFPGEKRMRARVNWNNSSADPCEVWSYGETEDYTVVCGTVLPGPENLAASLTFDDVTLDWDAPSGTTPNGYNVYRNSTVIASDITTLTYDDLALAEGNYVYTVKAIFDEGESMGSNMVSVVVDYATPQNVATSVENTDVTITWDAVGGKVMEGYNVYSNGTLLNANPITETQYVDADLFGGTYCYTVTTVYDGGESAVSEESCETITSIDIQEASQLVKIYPIPADEAVTISSENVITSLRIYSLTGQLVANEVPNNSIITLNTSSYKQGVYIVNMVIGENTVTRRLVIK